MARKLSKKRRDAILAALPELPLLLCVHCSQMTPITCSPRAWKWASEKCPTYKQMEYDFYKRIGGGPVGMTSATRGKS
jgi:hypothetical protein